MEEERNYEDHHYRMAKKIRFYMNKEDITTWCLDHGKAAP